MLVSEIAESEFALKFVRAKRKQIEKSLNIYHLDILVAAWIVYEFMLKNNLKFQSVFKEDIDIYKSDALLPEIISELQKAQKRGAKLEIMEPLQMDKFHGVM